MILTFVARRRAQALLAAQDCETESSSSDGATSNSNKPATSQDFEKFESAQRKIDRMMLDDVSPLSAERKRFVKY